MRVNRLYIIANALALALANLAVPFGLAALPYYDVVYLVYSCACAAGVFFLAVSENRWRFPWWGSLGLAVVVIWLAVWLEGIDKEVADATHVDTANMLPAIYLFLTLQTLVLVKLTAPPIAGRITGVEYFWVEHAAGLVFVLFACAVCKEGAFGVLLLLYIAAAAVALLAAHFCMRQEGAPVFRVRVSVRPLRPPVLEPPGRLRPGSVLSWSLMIVPLVLLLFLCIPRPDFVWGQWFSDAEPFADGMDLNRTGRVRLGRDPAFTVTVTGTRGNRAPLLGLDQRWRGEVFTTYQQGRWYPPTKYSTVAPAANVLPDFGPNQLLLSFSVDPKRAGGQLLAEPVRSGKGAQGETPPVTYGAFLLPTYPTYDQATATLSNPALGSPYVYTQVVPKPDDPNRMPASPAFRAESLPSPASVPPNVRLYAATLIHDLASQNLYGLVESDLEDDGERDLSPRATLRGERLAVALADYLRLSRDFNYSLDRPRYDRKIDPTEDFLVNVRRGHCERFAGGLALMLRSQGVPVRVVVGYQGWEMQPNGEYLVRQDKAHAWVEALVPPKGTTALGGAVGAAGCEYWLEHDARPEWLALEPTAPYYPPMPPASTGWFNTFWTSFTNWLNGLFTGWNFNLLNFDGHMQADFFAWAAANLPYLLVVVLVLLVLVYLARFALRWVGVTTADAMPTEPFYQRLLHLLAWYRGLEPQPEQTPREFGVAAAHVLGAEPKSSPVAALPAWIIELYYRVRFGGRPLAENEKAEVEARLEQLTARLKAR
jgi:transglutaminase-like putative cysteine protease